MYFKMLADYLQIYAYFDTKKNFTKEKASCLQPKYAYFTAQKNVLNEKASFILRYNDYNKLHQICR